VLKLPRFSHLEFDGAEGVPAGFGRFAVEVLAFGPAGDLDGIPVRSGYRVR
jgi:hypothetical protein